MAYLLAEWQRVDSVVIAWPFANSDWGYCLERAQACYIDILKTLANTVKVRVLVHPTMAAEHWRAVVDAAGVERHNILPVFDIAYDDTWIRDYGPLSLNTGFLNAQFDGWGGKYCATSDNAVSEQLLLGVEGADVVVTRSSLVMEGGALEINDQRLLFANRECLLDGKRNPELSESQRVEAMCAALGATDIALLEGIHLTGDDTDGHIDTIARLTPGGGCVYSGPNDAHCDARQLRYLAHQISVLSETYQWQLFPLPTPQIYSQYDQRVLPATYTNYLIVNDTVFAPTYGVDEDDAALAVLRQAFTDKIVVAVRCEILLEQHGSLHCATMQLHHRW